MAGQAPSLLVAVSRPIKNPTPTTGMILAPNHNNQICATHSVGFNASLQLPIDCNCEWFCMIYYLCGHCNDNCMHKVWQRACTATKIAQLNLFLGLYVDTHMNVALARINYSCRPHVNHLWRPGLQQTLVFATRHVFTGYELFTTYGPSECLDTAGRRFYLQEGLSFHCMCDMCSKQESFEGDARIVQVYDLHAAHPIMVHQGHHQKAIQIIDQCVVLLREQGIRSVVFTMPLFKLGNQVALMDLKDNTLGRTYLVQQTEALVQC
jgi:hypothetical protein